MVHIEYDLAVVEEAAFHAARGSKRLQAALHAAVDPAYAIADEELRAKAFQCAYRKCFEQFGLDQVIPRLIAEREIVANGIDRCIVREAPREKSQSAELFVKTRQQGTGVPERTLIIRICPLNLIMPETAAPWLRRELLHVADMLDDSFGYCPTDLQGGTARDNLRRDRYRVMWDIFVEGRLMREGKAGDSQVPQLWRFFRRAFACGETPEARAFLDGLLNAAHVNHRQLLSWAGDMGCSPEAAEGATNYGARSTSGSGVCPLCGGATYDWYTFDSVAAHRIVETIRAVRQDWDIHDGACRRCVEMYTTECTLC